MSLKDRAVLLGNRLEALKGGRANTATVSMTNGGSALSVPTARPDQRRDCRLPLGGKWLAPRSPRRERALAGEPKRVLPPNLP